MTIVHYATKTDLGNVIKVLIQLTSNEQMGIILIGPELVIESFKRICITQRKMFLLDLKKHANNQVFLEEDSEPQIRALAPTQP